MDACFVLAEGFLPWLPHILIVGTALSVMEITVLILLLRRRTDA